MARGPDASQRAADLAALAGARAMHAAYPRLFEPAVIDGVANPRHLEKAAYLELGERAAVRVARGERGAGRDGRRSRTADSFAPVRIRVRVEDRIELAGRGVRLRAVAEAELGPAAGRGRVRHGRRLRRAAGHAAGQADAPGCRAGLRPHGGRGARATASRC